MEKKPKAKAPAAAPPLARKPRREMAAEEALVGAALADLLLALMAGLRVNARADFGGARQRRAVDLALAVLDSG